MIRQTIWLQLLLLVLILKQSDAAAYQSGELQEEIDRSKENVTNTTELKHNNGEQADNCCACQSMLEAARSGEADIVKNLLKCCKDNCTDGDNTTPLMWAAAHGRVLVVRVLLEGGANAETANDRRWTALNAAAKKGRVDVCRLLLDWGAKVDTRNILGDTPLHGAAEAGHLSVVKLLVERGADVSVKNNAGMTPLHGAAWFRHLSVVKLLVERGADVNAKNEDGSTPLHVAAWFRHLSVVKLLVEMGADVNAKNEDGSTPLQYAAINGHLSMAKLLVEGGADVRLKYKPGGTASEWARAQGNEDVAEWLDSVQESVSHDVDTEATNGTATDCLTTSVPSQNRTAILESGQQQGELTAAGEPTETLDSVSKEEDKDCGSEEDACRSLLEAARSGDVDRAKGLVMCDSSDNCTDGSFFPVTPQTDGPLVVHVDIASNNSRLRDPLAEVKASGNSPVTKAPVVMSNDYDQIAKECEEQTVHKFADKIAKEFQNQTARDDVWRKVLEDQTASDMRRKVLEDKTSNDDGWRKLLENQTASDDELSKVLEEQTASEDELSKVLEEQPASDDGRWKLLEDQTARDDRLRKVLEDQTTSDLWRKVLEVVKKLKINENLRETLEEK